MAEAEEWAAVRVRELALQLPQNKKGQKIRRPALVRPERSTLTVSQLVNLYLADPAIKTLKSYDTYSDLANWWMLHYGDTMIFDVGHHLLYEARDKLSSTGWRHGVRSPATVNRHLATLRLIWNWGLAKEWIPPERTWPRKVLLPEPEGRNRFLSTAELNRLFKAAESFPGMKAAILVSVATGMRQGELLRLKWEDIDPKGSTVTILKTKNGTPRRVHLTSQALIALNSLKSDRDETPSEEMRVFVLPDGQPMEQRHLESRWRPIRKAAQLNDFRWHDLRHTCASYLAQNGASELEIGSVLGHKSPVSTRRYSHFTQGAPVKGHAGLDDMLKGK
jgi:integrase